MQRRRAPTPGVPASPDPPDGLVEIGDTLVHPEVTQVGLTTTPDGRWALLVQVRPDTPVPLEDVERLCGDYPVVYEDAPDEPMIARPAYPILGE